MGFSANLLMPTCGGVRPMPAGMYVENFNAPADVNGYFDSGMGITPVSGHTFPAAGVIQTNSQEIYVSKIIGSEDFYFEAKFFGPNIPVFSVLGSGLSHVYFSVDFGAIQNTLPTVAHIVCGRQGGQLCAWLNGQKISPTMTCDQSPFENAFMMTGSPLIPYPSDTLDALRFAVGTYYDPAAATIPVPVGDLTW